MIFVSGFYDLSLHEPRRTSTEEWAKRASWLFAQEGCGVFFATETIATAFRFNPALVTDPAIHFDSNELLRVEAFLSRSRLGFYDPTKDTARYLCLMRKRYDWMLRATQLDIGGPEVVFTWVDFGLPHADDDSLLEVAKRTPAPGKIRLANISYVPRYARADLDVYYGRHWWPVGGGLWSARKAEIVWLAEKISEEWRRCLDLRFAVTDEMMLGRIVLEHPEKFDLYYADHTSLAANWNGVRRSHALIAHMALEALKDGSPEEARERFLALGGAEWAVRPANCRHCGRPIGSPGLGYCWYEPACSHKPQEEIG